MKTQIIILLGLLASLSAQAKSDYVCTGNNVVIELHMSSRNDSLKVMTPHLNRIFSSDDCERSGSRNSIEIHCWADRNSQGQKPQYGAHLTLDFDGRNLSEANFGYFAKGISDYGPEGTGIYLKCE